MTSTFACAICGKTMEFKGHSTGMILAEAEWPNLIVCLDCEPEAERRNQRHARLIAAAPEMWDLCVRFIAEIEQYVNEPALLSSMNRLAENLASLYKDATVIHERVLGGK